jgi:hypothetical protein
MDSIVAALGKNDRVREIKLGRVPSLKLEEVLAAYAGAISGTDTSAVSVRR